MVAISTQLNLKTCDICHDTISDVYVDGATRMGPWANMCKACYKDFGIGVGTGLGQLYVRRNDDRKWVKVEG